MGLMLMSHLLQEGCLLGPNTSGLSLPNIQRNTLKLPSHHCYGFNNDIQTEAYKGEAVCDLHFGKSRKNRNSLNASRYLFQQTETSKQLIKYIERTKQKPCLKSQEKYASNESINKDLNNNIGSIEKNQMEIMEQKIQ